jgi:hypothetical protein
MRLRDTNYEDETTSRSGLKDIGMCVLTATATSSGEKGVFFFGVENNKVIET